MYPSPLQTWATDSPWGSQSSLACPICPLDHPSKGLFNCKRNGRLIKKRDIFLKSSKHLSNLLEVKGGRWCVCTGLNYNSQRTKVTDVIASQTLAEVKHRIQVNQKENPENLVECQLAQIQYCKNQKLSYILYFGSNVNNSCHEPR